MKLHKMIKRIIRKLFSFFDIGLFSISNKQKNDARQLNWIRSFNAKTIIDIGANTGQYAQEARSYYPNAFIYSFEPLIECVEEFKLKFSGDEKVHIYNCALGNKDEIVEMNKNNFTASSSLLEMLELHKTILPISSNTRKIKINVKKLDDFKNEIKLEHPLLIKLDVQGFEKEVIEGGGYFFDNADIIIVELTFIPVYENQSLFDDIYCLLKEKGFAFRGYYGNCFSDIDGTIVQCDGIFIKNIIKSDIK